MTRPITSLLVAVLGGLSALGLAACGEEESDARLLPPANAEEIERNLDDLVELIDECRLDGAMDAADDVRREVGKVADRIDPELRRNLLEGVHKLEDAIEAEDCEPETQPEETPEEEPVVPEETTEETTQEEETTPEEEPQPSDGDEDGDGGDEEGPAPEPAPEPAPQPPPQPAPGPTPPAGTGGVGPGQSTGGSGG